MNDLLRRLDTTPYAQRGHLLAHWGSEAEVDATRRALAASEEPWHRSLAVVLSGRRHDAASLLTALRDPSVQVRRLACHHAVRHVPEDDLAHAAQRLDPATRRRLLQHVARHGLDGVARGVAPGLLERGEHADLLVVVHLLDWSQVQQVLATVGPWRMPWKRLALAHPEEVAAHAHEQLGSIDLPSERRLCFRRLCDALAVLPLDTVVELFARHDPGDTRLLVPRLGPLLEEAPGLMVDLLAAPGADRSWTHHLGHQRARHLRQLDDEQLTRLGVHLAPDEVALVPFLRALPPSRRETVFDAVLDAFPDRMWKLATLDVLPHAHRHRQAQRHLARMRSDADGPASIAPWLPVEDAVSILVPEGRPRQKDGEDRARTWTRWVASVGRDRRGLDGVLAKVGYLRNEQDPVRLAVMLGLSGIPVSMIRPEHLEALDTLATALLEARDTSHATRNALQVLALRLIVAWAGDPNDPRFQKGLHWLERLRAHGGALPLPRLDRGLRRGAERPLCDAILGHLRAAAERERGHDVVALASALGERAWALDDLQDLLGVVALTDRETWVRASAIDRWLGPPRTRDERVARLLADDESSATRSAVWRHLSGWRTDRLDPFLEGRRLTGRWGSSKAGWIPFETELCHRWLPRQQRALVGLLTLQASDGGHNLATRAWAVKAMAPVPATRQDDLLPWLSAEVQLAEAALGALASLDRPDLALPVLLDHLDDDRARVAMYAVPRAARRVAPEVLERALASVLDRERLKVTVHKEVIRLLGSHRLPRAAELVEAQWARALHRDVRIALLHAVTSFLHQPWAWDLLGSAVADPDPELALVLTGLAPWNVPTAYHARFLRLLSGLARHPDTRARRAWFEHLARDHASFGRADLPVAVESAGSGLLDVPEVARAAAVALGVLGSLHDEPVLTAIDRLRSEVDREPAVPEPDDPDRPHLRTLDQLLLDVAQRTLLARDRYRPLARALLARLSTHTPTWPARAALVLALHPGDDTRLDELLDAPHVLDLHGIGPAVQSTVADPRRTFALDVVLRWVDELAVRPDASPLRLAMVCGAAARHGWGPDLRHRLGQLRGDAMVGREALTVVV